MEISYKRILLKLSGEALAGESKHGVDDDKIMGIAAQIKSLNEMGVEVGVVIGGGNFWRGRNTDKMDKPTADYMGMLATMMNSLALRDALDRLQVKNVLMSAFDIPKFAETISDNKAKKYLSLGNVVIFGGGTGSPFFTTDTASSLRAIEIGADAVLLAKSIDAVYSDDPKKNPNATRYDRLTYKEMIDRNLRVIDLTAATLCIENNMCTVIFGLEDPNNIIKVVKGEKIGTIMKGEF